MKVSRLQQSTKTSSYNRTATMKRFQCQKVRAKFLSLGDPGTSSKAAPELELRTQEDLQDEMSNWRWLSAIGSLRTPSANRFLMSFRSPLFLHACFFSAIKQSFVSKARSLRFHACLRRLVKLQSLLLFVFFISKQVHHCKVRRFRSLATAEVPNAHYKHFFSF